VVNGVVAFSAPESRIPHVINGVVTSTAKKEVVRTTGVGVEKLDVVVVCIAAIDVGIISTHSGTPDWTRGNLKCPRV
jgi:hypothetical protein